MPINVDFELPEELGSLTPLQEYPVSVTYALAAAEADTPMGKFTLL
jgi:hypothetical protein